MTALSALRTHDPEACEGQTCVVHNPSEHHMRGWRINIRMDRRFCLAERICPHGVGHPDPDSLSYIERVTDKPTADVESVHGCDGCCRA